jgi:hypothetical protein
MCGRPSRALPTTASVTLALMIRNAVTIKTPCASSIARQPLSLAQGIDHTRVAPRMRISTETAMSSVCQLGSCCPLRSRKPPGSSMHHIHTEQVQRTAQQSAKYRNPFVDIASTARSGGRVYRAAFDNQTFSALTEGPQRKHARITTAGSCVRCTAALVGKLPHRYVSLPNSPGMKGKPILRP